MPKARRTNYKKRTGQKNSASTRPDAVRRDTNVAAATTTGPKAARAEQATRASSYQSLIMPAMVTLGCLGLAISFSFFTTDPNRFLYGGIAALMTLMWAFSFWLRLRNVIRHQKQQ